MNKTQNIKTGLSGGEGRGAKNVVLQCFALFYGCVFHTH